MKQVAPFLLVLMAAAAYAAAPPEPGLQIYGHVIGALDGTVISAVVDGPVSSTEVEDGAYGYAPDVFIVTRNDQERTDVNIYVGGTYYTTVPFKAGGLLELNIDARGLSFCGDGVCEGTETHESCSLDCAAPAPAPPPAAPPGGGPGPVVPPPPVFVGEANWSGDGATVVLYGTYSDTGVHVYRGPLSGCYPLRNAYAYFHVDVNGRYTYGRIIIRVERSWFAENDLNMDDVRIYRCDGVQWTDIGSERLGEEGDVHIYASGPTHFSVVVLTAQPNAGGTEEEQPEVNAAPPAPETPEMPQEAQPTGLTGFAVLGNAWILGLVVVVGMAGYLVYARLRG